MGGGCCSRASEEQCWLTLEQQLCSGSRQKRSLSKIILLSLVLISTLGPLLRRVRVFLGLFSETILTSWVDPYKAVLDPSEFLEGVRNMKHTQSLLVLLPGSTAIHLWEGQNSVGLQWQLVNLKQVKRRLSTASCQTRPDQTRPEGHLSQRPDIMEGTREHLRQGLLFSPEPEGSFPDQMGFRKFEGHLRHLCSPFSVGSETVGPWNISGAPPL
ncbi:uncharacterized protein LOC117284343 [Fukomys damarensis]|uniref:uncharacterized protein LOC117284343 n=1 Tax=Fukomys damarensis TaxID=885580 RepID=UPI0014553948|nr:uncharacterized protein LOC117284343 [Fukomys damarensis]